MTSPYQPKKPVLVKSGVLCDIMDNIFERIVGLPLEPRHAEAMGLRTGACATAVAGVKGLQQYLVVMQISEPAACLVAGAIWKRTFEHWSPEVKDVCGEITNMIAGNIKERLLGGQSVELPSVIHSWSEAWWTPDMQILHEQNFLCAGGVICVWVGKKK